MITIICLKAGKLYDAAYVNRLYAMLCRNTTLPFRFICFTERNSGINPNIETRGLPSEHDYLHGWWYKVWLFSQETVLSGRIFFFDLDTIIHNNIDELLLSRPTFGILQELLPRREDPSTKKLGSAIMSWDASWSDFIWQRFAHNPRAHMRRPGDARFLQTILDYSKISYWQNLLGERYICSVKADIFEKNRNTPPPSSRITCFHGTPRPHEIQNWPWLFSHWNDSDMPQKQIHDVEPVVQGDLGIKFPGLVYIETDVKPIHYIPINLIRHKPEDPKLLKQNKEPEKQAELNKKANQRYKAISENIKLDKSIYQIYKNLSETRTMYNPLHILAASDGFYYIIQGSQRLCALHALNYRGTLPCRLLYHGENLSQTRNAAIVHHPYRKVNL